MVLRRMLFSLVLVSGIVGCHTCDVCDDCGDAPCDPHYGVYGSKGCSSCGKGQAMETLAPVPVSPPASSTGSGE